MNTQSTVPYLNAFTVEEYEDKNGQTARSWTKIGVCFPHKDSTGFSVELRAFPVDGRLVLLPPRADEARDKEEPKPSKSRR